MATPVLGYWDIRGLAEPIRLMLVYCGQEYEDKRYICGDAPDYDRSSWSNVKSSMDLDFPNLPYFIDGETRITESFAIMKHIARKNNLFPMADVEHDRCNMLEGVVSDFRRDFTMMCYRPGYETNKVNYFKDLPLKLQKFDNYLADKKWLAGENLMYIDFALCEILDHIRLMSPDCLNKHEKVSAYVEKFFKLEKIAAYRSSSDFRKFPINNKMAHWGGKAE
ncbi:unnamed protein product [Clavelina lepadiformis]|uniref:glutathione transferase n=1 Tax=Clavelina lepadiformis TaxID=159417 RepID=A0ABP0H369_CLALP